MATVFDRTTQAPSIATFKEMFAIDEVATTGLNLSVVSGVTIPAGAASPSTVAGATFLLADNAINVIALNMTTGVLVNDGVTLITPHSALYSITTLGGVIVSCIDFRMPYYPALPAMLTLSDVLLASINGGQISGFRNIAINGDMSVSQVNTQTLVTTGIAADTYVIDQHIINAATAAVTAGQSSDATGLPTGFLYNLKIAGAASNTNVTYKHRIEAKNSAAYAGRTIAVSFYMYQDSGAAMAGVTVKAFCPTTTADTFAALTQEGATATASIANGGTITKYTAIIVLGAVNCARGLEIQIATNAALLAGKTAYITGFQVEGVSAGATQGSSFEHVSYETQLSRCQRYLPFFALTTNKSFASGAYDLTTEFVAVVNLAVPTRVPVTGIAVSAVNALIVFAGLGQHASSQILINTATIYTIEVAVTTAASTSGYGGFARGAASGYIYGTGAQL